MADMRRSRRPPAESSYGDVFGGPPKFSAAKPSDYDEIFGGGLASSGSIPFLDLPPAPEASDGVGFIDYSEIFGGFDGGNFAVDYEELFGGRKKTAKSSASSNGRAPVEPKFGRRAEEFKELLPEDVSKSQAACPLKNEFSSGSNHSDDGSKQFSMSYHSTTYGSVHDVISGDTHTTHLHAVPGYSYVIDSCPSLQDLRCEDYLKTEPNDFIPSASRNERVNDVLEEKVASPTSSTDHKKGFGADLSMNRGDSDTMFTAPEDGPLNAKHHSRSSSNYSTSSGDICYTDISYVGVSDINLQTQPSRVPPPSKPPPNISGNQESTKKKMYRSSRADHLEGNVSKHLLDHQVHYKVGAPKSRGRQGAAKDTSSCFFDVEKDASSAVAAMKEAMEQAQARLKTAKELMERQREILHSRKKLSNKEGTKCDEEEFKPSEEEKLLHDDMIKKPLQKEDKKMKGSALDESKKVIEVSKGALNHEEKERYIMTTEVSQQIRQGNGFKSSKMPSKLEEVFGEWKTEKQFYELVNDGTKFRVIKEAFQNQGIEKKPNHTTEGIEDMKNYSEKADVPCEFGAGKLGRGNESNETDDDCSRAVNLTWNEETSKTPNTILEAHTMKGNTIKLDEGCGSFHQKGTEKLQAGREAFVHGEDLKEQSTVEEAFVSGESDNNVESSNDAFKVDVDYSEPEAAAEAHELDVSGWTNLTSFSREDENTLNISQGNDIHNANAIKVAYKMCQGDAEEEFGHVKEGYLHENSENTKEKNRYQSRDEENEPTLDRFASASEHEESKKLNESQLSCMQVENDLESTASEPGDQVKQNLERPNQAVDTFQPTEYDNKLKLENLACCPDSTKVDTMETLLEELQNKNEYETPSEHENNSKPRSLEGDHEGNEKDTLKGVSENIVVDERLNILDAAQEDCWWTEIKDPGNVNHAKSLTNNEKLKSEETTEPEKECDKEKARKAEEEREREREREKDRLAVERATREARERALAEARERAERIAVERITAEARQRALAESREKAEKAAAEALERSLAEKALKEAKLRAERAAAERAMAEARERAVEKALTEKAAADARQRAERLNAMSRDKARKENESGDYFRASDKGNSSDVPRDARFPSAGFPGKPQRHGDTNGHGDSDSPLRCKARLERHQRTVERAAKALAEKNMRDILVQREQAERNRLAESLDADVRRWSAGKEGNLRALLSTLQYILGSESGWQPVPLTDVITGAAVKKAYRKATLCVHPDKLQQRGANIQQKYICEKVFDLLKDAWNKFHSEER